MSHPDPNGPPDLTPIQIGEVLENPVTRERAMVLELPWTNPEGRVAAELTALVGARVVGQHRHPAMVERFTVLEGELTVKRDGQTSILRKGETGVVKPGVWHDWWNASDRDARVRVEAIPGERFSHVIETLFGLARLGSHQCQGHAGSTPTRALCAGVQRRRRVSFPAAGGPASNLRCARSHRALAWVSRDLPPALAHRAGAAGMTSAFDRDGRIQP
jgi:quercetin dioxygenase-like cupin family protein